MMIEGIEVAVNSLLCKPRTRRVYARHPAVRRRPAIRGGRFERIPCGGEAWQVMGRLVVCPCVASSAQRFYASKEAGYGEAITAR